MTATAPLSSLLCALALVAARLQAEDPPAGPPDGWGALYSQGAAVAHAHAGAAAFVLEEGEVLHPLLAPGACAALFTGEVRVPVRGRYRFGLEVRGGRAQISLTTRDGRRRAFCASGMEPVATTDWIDLDVEPVEAVLSFQRDERGAATLRALWEMESGDGVGFRLEPISSRFVRAAGTGADWAQQGLLERRGRALLERKGCSNCHAPAARAAAAVGLRRGPNLDRIGARASVAWLARWLAEPRALRPGSDMPALFQDTPAEREEVLELVHYLLSVAPAPDDETAEGGEQAAASPARLRAGRDLYHSIGCVACHGALASPAAVRHDELLPGEPPSVAVSAPFGDLADKWSAGALAELLRDPARDHPQGRMPSLLLTAPEARLLADYLVERWGGEHEPSAPDESKAARGAEVFARRRCAACHALEGAQPAQPGPALDALAPSRGCLDRLDSATPRYDLAPDEREAIEAGIATARAAAGAPAPLDAALRAYEVLSCASCHARDGAGGPAADLRIYFTAQDDTVDLGDEGRIPPDLSGVGFKLHASWLREVLAGTGTARPYMSTRMPRFGQEQVGALAEALARLDGVVPHADVEEPRVSDEMVLAGRELMGRETGTCVSCHVFQDYPPAGTVGTDMTAFARRLRHEWWRAFIQDPQRYVPGTRMPAFAAGGRSTFDVYDGDAGRQAAAMWAYFGLGEFMPPPDGLASEADLRVEVGERPRILRTFLRGAGTRGIAVGFPVGVHYSFDAGAVRLVEIWKGDFLDATGAWSGRGGNVSDGRGPAVWSAPDGPPFVIGEPPQEWPSATGAEAGYEFLGYSLDAEGVPSFRYRVAGFEAMERVTPRLASDSVLRRFELHGLPAYLRVHARLGQSTRVAPEGDAAPFDRCTEGSGTVTFFNTRFHEVTSFTLEVKL